MSEKTTRQMWVLNKDWDVRGNVELGAFHGRVPVMVTEIPEEALPVPEFEVGQEVRTSAGSEGRVIHPPIWARGSWIVPLHTSKRGYFCIYASAVVPSTRTVTVELTEEEVAEVKKLNTWAPQSSRVGDAIRKLAAALEDE